MEGIFFYWIAWIGWTYVTFILEKTKLRLQLACFMLLLIIFSTHYITVLGVTLNLAIVSLLIVGYYLLIKMTIAELLYYLFICVITTITYVTFKLFEIYDPVWVVFHPTFKLAIIITFLIILLIKDQKTRVAVMALGVIHGEIIYCLFLTTFVVKDWKMGIASLDIVAISVSVIFVWFVFESFVKWLDRFVHQKVILRTSKR